MKIALITILSTICLTLSAPSIHTQTIKGVAAMTQATTATAMIHATGTFEVKMDPQPPEDKAGGAAIGRLLLDKHFHGDLEATSKGTMLAAGTAVKGSAGYVAIELVTGTLDGHTGTFVLQHTGTMTRGAPQLTITVVPDSGTGQLIGLTGKMTINIADGKHSYDFEYTLPEAP
jgi:Protein of unknown function (DUF3224)